MICKNCGNYNPDNAIFCKECVEAGELKSHDCDE